MARATKATSRSANSRLRLDGTAAFASEDSSSDNSSAQTDPLPSDLAQSPPYPSDVEPAALRKSWFLGAHILLPPGSVVADMGCGEGDIADGLAALHPEWTIKGFDADEQYVKAAADKHQRTNLSFERLNAWSPELPAESFDGIIDSFLLHEIYSNTHLNDRLVSRTIAAHYDALRLEGYLVIRDYALPSAAAYVMMEFPTHHNAGDTILDCSEADLLVTFSQIARSGQQGNVTGFFLEELPPRFPHTRLFRLPYKWAYEFILRKDDRENFESSLVKEYTFFTEWDYRRELRALGARLLYSAPHYDDDFIAQRCEGKFRLYREDGTPLAYPPTSHVFVAQKVARPRSTALQEWRTSGDRPNSINITALRDDASGRIVEIAGRTQELAELLPWTLDEEGQLKVFLHESLPRGLVNAVPRNGKNLDGRSWSGHMIEALSLPSADILELHEQSAPQQKKQIDQRFGLIPATYNCWMEGPGQYPDPASLDERIVTHYLRVGSVSQQDKYVTTTAKELEGFSSQSRLREYDAQAVLDAIAVGMIPSARLETQIQYLCAQLGVKVNTWAESPLLLSETEEPKNQLDIPHIISHMAEKDGRFKGIRGSAGQIRPVQSIFVEEGQDENGGINGIASQPLDFVVPEDNTINTAVIIPLCKTQSGEVMAGVIHDFLPVPQRYSGNGSTVRAPSIRLPKEVQSIEDARKFIAEKFEVSVEEVGRLGESYFTHIGMTPHRIYPFAVCRNKGAFRTPPIEGRIDFAPIKNIGDLHYYDCDTSLLTVIGRVNKRLNHNDMKMEVNLGFAKSQVPMAGAAIGLHSEHIGDVSSASSASDSAGGGSSDSSSSSSSSGGSEPANNNGDEERRMRIRHEARRPQNP